MRKPRIGDSLAIRCDAQIPAGSEIIRRWYYQNVTTIPVNAMKRVSLLENGDILYFSNIIEKDDGLKIYCQAIEKATRNKFLPVLMRFWSFSITKLDWTSPRRWPETRCCYHQ